MAWESEASQREPLVSSEHEVVALVAHELRHPLAAIEAALPLTEAPQPETRQKAKRVLERQVVYLRRLVDDLLMPSVQGAACFSWKPASSICAQLFRTWSACFASARRSAASLWRTERPRGPSS